MAKTGIKITTTDTVLGKPIDVNTTSMIISVSSSYVDTEWDGGVVKVRSVEEAPALFKPLAERYYNPAPNISLSGSLLWCAGIAYYEDTTADDFVNLIRRTVATSFDERPRQIIIVTDSTDATVGEYVSHSCIPNVQTALTTLQSEGIRCVAIVATFEEATSVTDCSTYASPFVAFCPMGDSDDVDTELASTGSTYGSIRVLGLLSSLSVGTSIGDGGLAALVEPHLYLTADERGVRAVDVRTMTLDTVNQLGEAQQLFTRTRPPRNGLWWNDGATCNDPKNALSTLEMSRTICAMADDLQSFFVPYINTRVPVTSTGDIQSAYKQVVLDNARAAVVQKYIDNGDISDARISLVAKDNDMIGTRTWEVTLSILPAPTLRWIDGYVFYVNSLE
jgi:hypothetical protein